MTRPQESANREFWDRDADDYQTLHGAALAHDAAAWGVWRVPESRLQLLGDVRGARVLELGCGAAQWSLALHDAGAQPIGLDLSATQLRHAARRVRGRVPLTLASGSVLPFADGAFDLVVSDHGAPQFCAPGPLLAEVHRVLRPGGAFVLCVETALHASTWDEGRDRQSKKLQRPMLGVDRIDWADGTSDTVLTEVGWIRAFRAAGFAVDDAVELTPDADAHTTFTHWVPDAWARQWPAEIAWRLTR